MSMLKQTQKNKKVEPFRFEVVEEKGEEITMEVKKEDYEKDLAAGIPKDELLSVGQHTFKKVSPNQFGKKEALNPSNTKVQITMKIDLDVLNYFKERASEPNTAPYQTQINNELRATMENSKKTKVQSKRAKNDFESLLTNKKFIKALAKEVKKVA